MLCSLARFLSFVSSHFYARAQSLARSLVRSFDVCLCVEHIGSWTCTHLKYGWIEAGEMYIYVLNEVFNVQIEEYAAQFNRNEWEKDRVWLKQAAAADVREASWKFRRKWKRWKRLSQLTIKERKRERENAWDGPAFTCDEKMRAHKRDNIMKAIARVCV